MRYHIVSVDNRGTDKHPFGKIYLSDKKDGEIIGDIGYGAHHDDPNPYAIWPTRNTPQLGRDHSLTDRARQMLRQMFPDAGQKATGA